MGFKVMSWSQEKGPARLSGARAGELLVDGLPLERFGYRSYRRQVSGILQEDSMFAGSIAENIALFADTLDMTRVIEAAIHADIMQVSGAI